MTKYITDNEGSFGPEEINWPDTGVEIFLFDKIKALLKGKGY